MRAKPVATTTLVPIRRATTTEKGAMTSRVSATGATRTPAWRALYPNTNCRYWVMRKNMPSSANSTRASAAMATL